jgi:flagellar hook protein FlgE
MGLFGALLTADSGLTAQQNSIGNISQNIANSQTVGYKGVGTEFEELVTQSNQNYNAPGGVIASPVYQNNLAGSLVQSATGTNLAISGSGFFAVAAPTSSGTTSAPNTLTTYYTRRGDFQLDQNDYLVNGSGDYLLGYNVTNGVTNPSGLVPIQVKQLVNSPVPTANVNLTANLPSGATTAGTPTTVTVYDAEGNPSSLGITFAPVTTGSPAVATPNAWTATITDGATTSVLNLTFNSSSTSAAGTLASISSASTGVTVPGTQTAGSSAAVGLTINGQSINLNLGSFGSSSGLTQYAGTAVTVSSLTQDGVAQGTFSNVSVDDNGFVSLNYSNGQSVKYFQIPLAQFNAAQNLQAMSGQTYQATSTSGQAQVSVAGQNGVGTITPSALEESNVDIASQFTNLIVAQEAYSANTKVVSTANQLIQSLLQIIT